MHNLSSELCEFIRKRIADHIDGGANCFCIDSKLVEVCRVSRGKYKQDQQQTYR